MTTRHLADPELLSVLGFFPATPFTPESLLETRSMFAAMAAAYEETGVNI